MGSRAASAAPPKNGQPVGREHTERVAHGDQRRRVKRRVERYRRTLCLLAVAARVDLPGEWMLA
jgi:hypothetical protein